MIVSKDFLIENGMLKKYKGKNSDVVIPSGVTCIAPKVFSGKDITSITIPSSVNNVGKEAFIGCNSLLKVNFLGTIDEWAQIEFADATSNPATQAGNLYINDALVTEVVLTSTPKIAAYAFEKFKALTKVTIPDSVSSIESSAFSWCGSLRNVIMPNSITSIGNYAFSWCGSLNRIELSNCLKHIGWCAFEGCGSLIRIVIPKSVTAIGRSAFESSAIKDITFKDSDNWYRTWNFSMWDNKTYGTKTDLSYPENNAELFKFDKSNNYWFKK